MAECCTVDMCVWKYQGSYSIVCAAKKISHFFILDAGIYSLSLLFLGVEGGGGR